MEEFTLKSNFDSLELSCLLIKAKGKARGIVQISHGMAEHKERYIPFMEFLSSKGFIVIIHDHRGHGKSIKSIDDYGYFYDNTGDAIIEDVHQITLYIKDKYPKLPLYLFGHSMGSMVVRKYIKKYDKDIDKLIVCGAPSKNPKVGLAIKMVKASMLVHSDKYRSKLINKLTFGSYNKKFRSEQSKNAWVCSDKEVVSAYDNDEACGFIFTLNGFLNLFILMRDIYNADDYLVRNPHLKILFVAGTHDPVIISKRDFEESQMFLKDIGYHDVRGILYNGMRHEILNEKAHEEVFADILEFLES